MFLFYLIVFVLLGAMLGGTMASAVTCLIGRERTGEPWATIRGEQAHSHCDFCGHTLSAADLVPVWSYLLLRGRCRYCGKKIAPTSFYMELLWSVIFGVFALIAILHYDAPSVVGISGAVTLALILGSVIRLKRRPEKDGKVR